MNEESQVSIEPSAPPIQPPRRNWWRMLFLGCVILVSGIIIGSVGTLVVIRRNLMNAIIEPGYMPRRMVDHLSWQLNLDPEQTRQLHDIIHEKQRSIRHLRRLMVPPFMLEIEQFQKEVEAILTPEQAEKWDTICKRMRKTWIEPLRQSLEDSDGEAGDGIGSATDALDPLFDMGPEPGMGPPGMGPPGMGPPGMGPPPGKGRPEHQEDR